MRLRSLRLFILSLSLLTCLTSQAEASFVLLAPAAELEGATTGPLRSVEGQQVPWSSQEWVDLLTARVVPNYAFDVHNVSHKRGLGAGPPPGPIGASGALHALAGDGAFLCSPAVDRFMAREEHRRAIRTVVHIFRPPRNG